MLSIKAFATYTVATAFLAFAAPAIEKRTPGGVYMCTDANWQGTCGYQVQPLNTCIPLDYPWWQAVSSFGPDQGTECDLYSDYYCQDMIINDIGHPGYDDLDTVGLNDATGSFICYEG